MILFSIFLVKIYKFNSSRSEKCVYFRVNSLDAIENFWASLKAIEIFLLPLVPSKENFIFVVAIPLVLSYMAFRFHVEMTILSSESQYNFAMFPWMPLHHIFMHSRRYYCTEYLFIPNLTASVHIYI